MPRTTPATRMVDIAAAARSVFIRQGYRRAQVADVARAAGLSPAALYRHVESKDALFHLCFLEDAPGADEYVSTPPPGATADLVRTRFDGMHPDWTLRRAVKRPAQDRAAELTTIIGELYRAVQHHRELLALLEASAQDRPDLHEVYFRRSRGRHTDDLARYLVLGADAGAFRRLVHPELVATQIRESCAWFAWHRHGDHDPPAIDDDEALAAIIDVHVTGLLIP